MAKKSLSSISWKPKHSFQLKVIQTICISVEPSSSWLPSAKDPFSYLTNFLWNMAGIILIPPRSLRDHGHQVPDCSFTQRTAWSCFLTLNLIEFLPQKFALSSFFMFLPFTVSHYTFAPLRVALVCLPVCPSLSPISPNPLLRNQAGGVAATGPAAVVARDRTTKVSSGDSCFPFQQSQHCGFVDCLFTSRFGLTRS